LICTKPKLDTRLEDLQVWVTVTNLQALADKRLSQAQALKLQARLEDLQVWEQRKVKDTKTGAKTYTHFMASWREGKRIRNVYLGSSLKMSLEQAHCKAKAMKRGALGLSPSTWDPIERITSEQ
jgi:hypothetical protein